MSPRFRRRAAPRKASPLAARTPGCSAVSAARSARRATTRCATSAACSSRCTGAAASATTCSPSAPRRSSASTRASPRSRICSTRAAARRAASAARRSCAARASARTAAGRSIRRPARRRRLGGDGHRAGARGLMATGADERERAIAAADTHLPALRRARASRISATASSAASRCRSSTGTVPALRRRWLRRFGWYPGDWVWISLADAARRRGGRGRRDRAHRRAPPAQPARRSPRSTQVSVAEPTAVPTTTPARRSTPRRCRRPPSRRRPRRRRRPARRTAASSGRANENGWTIVLVSYPKTNGRPSALATADRGRRRTDCTRSGSSTRAATPACSPGYFVVFTGIYGSTADADAGVGTARQAGFGGAYSRQIAR